MDSAPPVTPAGPLAGVRVLDLTSVVMGPLATQILADLGAEVIVVEPRGGDMSRFMDEGVHPQLSGVALNLLRNKRNIAVDYKSAAGREVVLRIGSTCDVVVTNHRPGVARRARLEYQDFVDRRSDIIYCQAVGNPSGTDLEDLPAYDDVVQAAAGVADANRLATGRTNLAPTLLADKVSGISIVYAVSAALFARERHGAGARIEVPMVDVTRAFMLVEHGGAAISNKASGVPGYARILTDERRPQVTKDGMVFVLPYSKQNYDDVFEWGARPDLVNDERYLTRKARVENSEYLYRELREIVAQRTTDECINFCRKHNIPAFASASLAELVAALPEAEHPVAGTYRIIPSPIRYNGRTASVRQPAPLIGQHTAELLSEVGYSQLDVTKLLRDGVVTLNGLEARPTGSGV